MKRAILFAAFMFLAFAATAQQIGDIIKTRTVLLTREGQRDSLLLPLVSDKYPALKKALSIEKLLNGDSLNQVVQQYFECGCGVTGLNYQVAFLKMPVISIRVFYEFMGAYPSSSDDWYTLNVNTGKPFLLKDEITDAGLKWIAVKYKARLKQRILNDKKHNSGDTDAAEVYPTLLKACDTLRESAVISNYIFGETGITFTSDTVLPHVVESYEPDREVFFSYELLKPFVRPAGRFITLLMDRKNQH